jgi:signal transduction histidine kinase
MHTDKKNLIDPKHRWIFVSIFFAAAYWVLESIRDVVSFGRGNLIERIFCPDTNTFWLRLLVVLIILLYGSISQLIQNRQAGKSDRITRYKHRQIQIILAGMIVALSYWTLESIRDSLVYNKGDFFEQFVTPDVQTTWLRILAMLMIALFSIYAQQQIDDQRKTERKLMETQMLLSREVDRKTHELRQSNSALLHEIEERKSIEKALDLSHKSFHNIVAKVNIGLVIVDTRGIIQFTNPAFPRLLSKGPDLIGQVLGIPFLSSCSAEIQLNCDNGVEIPAELCVSDTSWNGEKAFLISIQDITERKKLEYHKEEFVRNISHELRTPMTSIRESLALIYDGSLGAILPEQQKYLNLSIQNIDRLKRMIDDLLDIAKLEAKKLELYRQWIDIVPLLQKITSTFGPHARSKGLKLKLKLDFKSCNMYLDADRITQIFYNLLNNAFKFTDQGEIVIHASQTNDHLICSVSDTGRGMAPEDTEVIFDKFKQLSNSGCSTMNGTGLGLAITKELIELHGGSIRVKSERNQGTCFIFTLPKESLENCFCHEIDKFIRYAKKNQQDFSLFVLYSGSPENGDQKPSDEQLARLMKAIHKSLKADHYLQLTNSADILGIVLNQENETIQQLNTQINQLIFEQNPDMQEPSWNLKLGWVSYPECGENAEQLYYELIRITQAETSGQSVRDSVYAE